MVHAICQYKCPKCGGTDFHIGYDSNKCGCHHNGLPCVEIVCTNRDCFWSITLAITKKDEAESMKELSLCKKCHCMTWTINGKCGKCKAKKEAE